MSKILKRITAYTLVGAIVVGSFSGYSQVNGKAVDTSPKIIKHEKEKKYIIKANSKKHYAEIEEKLKSDDKIFVNHKQEDETYLESNGTIVAEIDKKEIDNYIDDLEVMVEEDYDVTGSEIITVPQNDLFNVYNSEENHTTELKINAEKISLPEDYNKTREEYSDNPYEFVPCDEVTDKDKINEIVPWNISCVAGKPDENKHKGKKVKVAVIDSGIDTHNELNTVGWVDFSDKVEGYKPIDSNGHGTSVAGIIAARINGVGIQGIASESELYSVKILDENNRASVSTVIKALEWCIENDIDIINMSFGMSQYSEILSEEIKKVNDKGILMVSAAGNNVENIQYPAAYPEVISVGSVNSDLKESDFSDNTYVDLVAPGENVQTLGYLGGYCITSGTSVATAHVTGVAASIKSLKKHITNNQLKDILINSGVVLNDGSVLVNYEEAVNYMKKNTKTYKPKEKMNKIKNTIEEKRESGNDVVQGSWSSDYWKGTNNQSTGTGHLSLINKMPISYFGNASESSTEKTINRTITADAVYRVDIMDWTSASGLGNNARDENGYVLGTKNGCYSPYHAKAEYDLNEVLNHMFFLYELARRRLVLGSNLDLVSTNYSGDYYYDQYIGQKMKRRIIVDMSALYEHQSIVFGGSINMNTVRHKGYMVLGAYLHLVQDLQAHRAEVTANMLYKTDDGIQCYGYNTMVASKENSIICANHIKGMKEQNYDKYWELYYKIKNEKSIPIIKLKNYLVETDSKNVNTLIDIYCNGGVYYCTAAQAYEDNPFFYQDRYSTAYDFTCAYIDRMYNDKGYYTKEYSYYASEKVPLYSNKWN